VQTAYCACLVGASLLGAWRFIRCRERRPADRWIAAFFPLIVVLLAAVFLQPILDAPYRSIWNQVRVAPAVSLAAGYTLYYPTDQGPVTGNIYGPMASIAFLPATAASTPSGVLRVGTALSLCLYFMPLLWLARFSHDRDGAGRQAGLFALALFPIVTFLRPGGSLEYVATLIHADAPALGFGGAACAVLYTDAENRWRSLALSALFGVLAVWSKQVMGPLLVAMPLWLWWDAGFRTAVRYAAWSVGAGVLIAAVSLTAFDGRALVFNLLNVPGHHPVDSSWGKFPENLLRVMLEWLSHGTVTLGLLSVGVILTLYDAERPRSRWTLFLVAALAVLPTSIWGRLKVGGDRNALSFSLYFLLLAACLLLRERAVLGRYWLVVLAVSGGALLLIRAQQERFAMLAARGPSETELVHAYLQGHPGEAYFPWNPLGHLLAEGRLHHFDYGLFDRELAGFPPSADHVRAGVPSSARFLCFPPTANMTYVRKYLPEYQRQVGIAELPGFACYERESSTP
jgi:hypothetical protein